MDANDRLWICPGFHEGTVRGQTDARAARVSRRAAQHLYGQAQRQGFQPAPVPADAAQAPAGGRPCAEIHRQARAQLRRDPEPVADDHEGEAGGHRRAGHAAARHPADGPGPDGHVYRGPCAANPLLFQAEAHSRDATDRRRKTGVRAITQPI